MRKDLIGWLPREPHLPEGTPLPLFTVGVQRSSAPVHNFYCQKGLSILLAAHNRYLLPPALWLVFR